MDDTGFGALGRREVLRYGGLLAAGTSGAALLSACGGGGAGGGDLTIWWNEGYYPEEDNAVKAAVAAWEKKSGKKASLQFYGTQDIVTKEQSAVTAGQPPDIVFAQKGPTAEYAWDGKLEDVTEVVKSGGFTDGALKSVQLYNNRDRKLGYYAVPMHQFTVSLFHWKSMVADVDMDAGEAPQDWAGYWAFWKDLQKAYRDKGNTDVHAIGWPMGSAAGDTNYDFQQVMRAYGVELLDEKGALRSKDPAVRQGLIESLAWVTDLYKQKYTPKSCINWQDSSNNTTFLARKIVVTPNGSLSIPGAVKDKKPEDWKDIVATGWPDRPDGTPMPALSLTHNAVVFANSPHKEAAKDFLTFLIKPENNAPVLEGSQARWFPCQKAILDDPFWQDSDDPNVQVVAEQLSGQTVPSWRDVSPAYQRAETTHLWGTVLGQIVLQGKSVTEAADGALAELERIFSRYSRE